MLILPVLSLLGITIAPVQHVGGPDSIDAFNLNWVACFTSNFVNHLPRISFDHYSIFLISQTCSLSSRNIFYFENFQLEYIGYNNAVRVAWNFEPHSSMLHAFNNLLSRTRHNLIMWQRQGLNPLATELKNIESHISHLELQIQWSGLSNVDATSSNYTTLRTLHRKFNSLPRQKSLKWF